MEIVLNKLDFFKIDYLKEQTEGEAKFEELGIEILHEEEEVYEFVEATTKKKILGLYYIDLDTNRAYIGTIKNEPYLGFNFRISWELDWEV